MGPHIQKCPYIPILPSWSRNVSVTVLSALNMVATDMIHEKWNISWLSEAPISRAVKCIHQMCVGLDNKLSWAQDRVIFSRKLKSSIIRDWRTYTWYFGSRKTLSSVNPYSINMNLGKSPNLLKFHWDLRFFSE
jgi:hypothetical protein